MSRIKRTDGATFDAGPGRPESAIGLAQADSDRDGVETVIAAIGQAFASDPRLITALQRVLGPANLRSFPERILRLPEVQARTGLSRSAIYAKINQGSFPAPKKLGVKMVGWYDSQITRWIEDPR